MKLVHAADIHLDSPLQGLARYDGAPVETIRGATRRALESLMELVLDEEADLLLIAGDLYDGDWRDYNTGLYFASQVARVTREGVRAVLVRGNHDAASHITRSLRLPEGVVELPAREPGTVVLEDLGVAVHGQSYARPDQRDDLAARYPEPAPGLFNVGLLHTALEGRPGHDRYAPCRPATLAARGYDYWALGHVHRREVVSEDPWIVFPGNLQGRHTRETGPKGATLIRVEEGRVASVEHRELDAVRWAVREVDVSECASGHDAVDLAREALEDETLAAGGRALAVRLEWVGRSRAHRELSRDPEQWASHVRALAAELGSPCWVQSVRLRTRSPIDLEALAGRDDPVSGVLGALRATREDPDALAALGAELEPLRARLPVEYRRLEGALDLGDTAALAGLLDDVEAYLVPALLSAVEDA